MIMIDHQEFMDGLEQQDLIRLGVIFPRKGLKFTDACSCDDCVRIIDELKVFEKELRFISNLVTKHYELLDKTEEICCSLHCAASLTINLSNTLHDNLQKLGIENINSAAEVADIDIRIGKLISESGLVKDYKVRLPFADSDAIMKKIDVGFHQYGHSKLVKNTARDLLKKIEEIERNHERFKKSARVETEHVDRPSVSKVFIEEQIKLVKELPVVELYIEIEEMIDKISPVHRHRRITIVARKFIHDTYRDMIKVSQEFWRRYRKCPSKDHSLSGLKQTLELLRDKANSFKNKWEEEYAPFATQFFTP